MMKKRIISIGILLAFLTAGFIYLNKVFASEHHYVNTTEDFKTLSNKTNIDVVFYGSSHSYTAYNPLIVNDICKTISYNLGSDGLKISLTDLVLNESLKYTSPKLIILEVYPPSLKPVAGDADKGYHLRAMDFVTNFSLSKLEKTIEIYNPNEYLGVYFPLIRNHSNWNSFNYFNLDKRKQLDYSQNFFYGGFLGSLNVMNEKDKKIYANFQTHPIKNETNNPWVKPAAKKNIEDFVEMAKSSGAEVLIISSPDPRARVQFNYYFYQEIRDLSASLNVSFLNLNDYYEEINMELDDFKDNSHLNTLGSIKATKFLAEYIKENYTLPDRSSEAIWKQEMTNYEVFKEDYYHTEKRIFEAEINKGLSDSVFIKSIALSANDSRNLKFQISFDSTKTDIKTLGKYRLAVHVYPENQDIIKLDESSKQKKANYDQTNTILEDNEDISVFRMKSRIRNIKKIEFFLFNSAGYDGIIGNKVNLNAHEFKNYKNEK